MPYPARINPESILAKTREMVDAKGADQLSLNALASALGVKAPSLYRYFASKTDLLRALNLQTIQQLIDSMHVAALDGDDPRTQLIAMSRAWRAFAHANPKAYTMAFAHPNPELRPDARLVEVLAIPIQKVITNITGEKRSLAALRGLWALLHGFVLLELSAQFRRGGDLGTAFELSVEAYLNGWGEA
jgi:AcrR family transcriptional regulator